MKLIYGVDSAYPATVRLTNGYTLYDWVMRMSCYPTFWGRYITGEWKVKPKELEFLRSKKCKIPCLLRHFKEEVVASNDGKRDAKIAVAAAKELDIPQNKGIALFADIPSSWQVNHNWMIGFSNVLLENGYLPGFVGNTDSEQNFCFDRQCSHYVQATKDKNHKHTLYWGKRPKYKFDPEVWAPYAPSKLLPKDMHLWQYGDIKFHKITVHKNYTQNESILQYFLE